MATTNRQKNTGVNLAPSSMQALLAPTIQFETEAGSPFSDGYSIEKESIILAKFFDDGVDKFDPLHEWSKESDPQYDRYVELLDRRERLQQMQAEHRERGGADVLAQRSDVLGLESLGGLVDETSDQMTIHTIEAYRMFLGRAREPGARQAPIMGGKRVASALKNLWQLTQNDNPYADWALVRHEHGVNEVLQHLRSEIKAAEAELDGMRKRGLNFAVLTSSNPQAVNLGFRSPYGYAISMLIVEYDYFVRIQKTLQRKNIKTDEQARAALSKVSRAILSVFYGTTRFDRWLSQAEIRALSRVDWVNQEGDAAKRVQAALEIFGPVPSAIYKGILAPSHSRRRYSLSDAERAVLQEVGGRLEEAEQGVPAAAAAVSVDEAGASAA